MTKTLAVVVSGVVAALLAGCSGGKSEAQKSAPIANENEATVREVEAVASDDSTLEVSQELHNAPVEPKSLEPDPDRPKVVDEKKSLEALIAMAEPAIVRIDVSTREGNGIGSGFVIDDGGVVVTNHHVIVGATSAKAVFADGTNVPVIGILGTDPKRDIAILKIQNPAKKLTSLKLLKALPQKGQRVVAFGAPQGLSFSASEGIISAIRSADELSDFGKPLAGEWIQTTTPISPGNSGGPLVDLSGQVVGINTFHSLKGQNLNFAVCASDIERTYDRVKNDDPLPLAIVLDAGRGLDGNEIRSLKMPPRFNYIHSYEIADEKKKFDTFRRITLGPVLLDGTEERPEKLTTLLLTLLVNEEERVLDRGVFSIRSLSTISTGLRFRDHHRLKFLIDGKLTDAGEMEWKHDIVSLELNNELMDIYVPLAILLKIARARTAEFAVANYEYAVSTPLRNGLRDLLSRVPITKTVSGIALEIDEQIEAENLQIEAENLRIKERVQYKVVESHLSENGVGSYWSYTVKLMSPEAKTLSLDELSDIALKVSKERHFSVRFYLLNMSLDAQPAAISARKPKNLRPDLKAIQLPESRFLNWPKR